MSETFILYQVTGLLDLGHDVRIISMNRPPADAPVHGAVEEYSLLERTTYFNLPASKGRLACTGLHALGSLAIRHGRRALPAIRVMPKRWGVPHPFDLTWTRLLCPVLQDCDVIHAHFGPDGRAALPAAVMSRLPLVVTFHGYDVGRIAQKHGAHFYALLFREGSAFMCVSEYLRERVIALGAPAEKTVLQYINSSVGDVPYRERTHRDGEPIRVLTVARLTEKKGLEYSIEAVRRLVADGVDVRYSIVGKGPLRPQLTRIVTSAGLDGVVKLRGALPRPEVLRLLDSAHLFMLTSVTAADGDTEGLPVVLREAQAAGLPVLTTDHAGNPEAIEDGVSGFLVPERDVDALAERLAYLIDNPHTWPEMGRAGRKFVEEMFDIRKLNRRLVSIYEDVIAGRLPSPDPI